MHDECFETYRLEHFGFVNLEDRGTDGMGRDQEKYFKYRNSKITADELDVATLERDFE